MYTNDELLQWAASLKYLYIHITPDCIIPHGQEHWEQSVRKLTTEQRAILSTKIEKCQARLRAEQQRPCYSS